MSKLLACVAAAALVWTVAQSGSAVAQSLGGQPPGAGRPAPAPRPAPVDRGFQGGQRGFPGGQPGIVRGNRGFVGGQPRLDSGYRVGRGGFHQGYRGGHRIRHGRLYRGPVYYGWPTYYPSYVVPADDCVRVWVKRRWRGKIVWRRVWRCW